MNTQHLESLDELNAFTSENPKALVIVSRMACPACDTLAAALGSSEAIAKALEGVAVATIKLDKVPVLASTFGLRMAPASLLFQDDDEISRIAGFDNPASYAAKLAQAFQPVAEAA